MNKQNGYRYGGANRLAVKLAQQIKPGMTLDDVQAEAIRAGAGDGIALTVAELVAWLCHGTAREVSAINDTFQLAQINDAAHTARELVGVTK